MKVEYERLEGKIKEAEENRFGSHEVGLDLAAFSNLHTKHHPTIIKVILPSPFWLLVENTMYTKTKQTNQEKINYHFYHPL